MMSPEKIKDLLSYDEESGVLYWLPRPLGSFSTKREHSRWNSRYSSKPAGHAASDGYTKVKIGGCLVGAHRIAYAIYHGHWPEEVDHINGDPSDNRVDNLREVSRQDNCKNRKCRLDNDLGLTGISKEKNSGKWKAYINAGGKQKTLGRFDDVDSAIQARLAAQKEFGYHENHGRLA